jgi:hypothetical protein
MIFIAGRIATANGGPRIQRRNIGLRFVARDPSPVGPHECKLDGRAWRACRSKLRLRHLSYGGHVLRLHVADKWGNTAKARAAWGVVRRSR